jgi:hypothetical protein
LHLRDVVMAPNLKSLPAGPGLLFIPVRAESRTFDAQSLGTWFQGGHLPRAPATTSTSRLTNWKSVDPSATSKYLSIWNVEDLATTAEEAGVSLSINDVESKDADGNDIVKSTKFDIRYYSLVEEFAKNEYDESKPARANCLSHGACH